MNEKEIQIHEWAEKRMFQELNTAEMSCVLEFMEARDYDDLYTLNQKASEELKSDIRNHTPIGSSLSDLKSAMVRHKANQKVALWNVKLPVYWTAAACVLVFLTSFFLFSGRDNPDLITSEKTIIQKVYDTLYVERPVLTEVVRNVYVPVETKPETSSIETSFAPDNAEYVKVVAPAPSAEGISKSFGNSAVSEDALEQFKVQM